MWVIYTRGGGGGGGYAAISGPTAVDVSHLHPGGGGGLEYIYIYDISSELTSGMKGGGSKKMYQVDNIEFTIQGA